jgi:CRP/FNR family cyclic AMP-dependent transcriptional regulator
VNSLRRSTVDMECILDVDHELLAAIPAEDADVARAVVRVPVVWAEPGAWEPPPPRSSSNYLGLLVLEGLTLRDVALAGMGCTELLGPGDILRPADQADAFPSVPFRVSFHVDERLRLALLDDRFAEAVRRWPSMSTELVRRSVRRSQSLAMHLAITCITGTDLRLHVLFWHLADRWGRVTPEGTVVPLRLTHETLGRLVRGRRPGISAGLKRLVERDAVHRREDGSWLLRGGPPDEQAVARRGRVGSQPDADHR